MSIWKKAKKTEEAQIKVRAIEHRVESRDFYVDIKTRDDGITIYLINKNYSFHGDMMSVKGDLDDLIECLKKTKEFLEKP